MVWFRSLLLCLGLCLGLALPGAASAQDDDSALTAIDRWAEAVVGSGRHSWNGPVVDWPEPGGRPPSAGVLRSSERPVNVQLGPRVSPERAVAALDALETAYDFLEQRSWPLPMPDGGRGGTAGFDLYLTAGDGERPRPVRADYDVPHLHEGLDAVVPFAVVDNDQLEESRLEGCIISAYVQATLLGVDPAEARAWRTATGDYVAWLLTGHFGCGERGVVAQQREAWRTWVGSGEESGEGGALLLALLSARSDGLTGDFIRDLWTAAPQRSWEGSQLRAAPDMWEAIEAVMEVAGDPLPRFLEDVAVSRYFSGPRSTHAPMRLLRALPQDAVVHVEGRTAFDELPRRYEPRGLELEPYGSAYVEVDTREAPAGSLLRIWLIGELGVGWALQVVRLDAEGRERGRMRAPVRPNNPRSYLPVELTDGRTATVVIVATNMGSRLADADGVDDQTRSFRLILDRGAE